MPYTNPSIAIAILAAGSSSRMGLPKQLLPMRGTNLLRYTIDQACASKANAVFVVLGSQAARIGEKLPAGKFTIVVNHAWTEGLGSSIRVAVAALPDSVDAVILSLCDQPFLSAKIFNTLMDRFASSDKSIVACEIGDSFGPPVLFSRKHFTEIASLRGDKGARSVIEMHKAEVESVPFPSGPIDLDTPEDYRQFLKNELGM